MNDFAPDQAGSPCLADSPIADITPAQQAALLKLHHSPLSRAVLRQIKSSTVRAGFGDYLALARMGYIHEERTAGGRNQLTTLGKLIAGMCARELARKFEITTRKPPRRRGGFGPGFSQAGNW